MFVLCAPDLGDGSASTKCGCCGCEPLQVGGLVSMGEFTQQEQVILVAHAGYSGRATRRCAVQLRCVLSAPAVAEPTDDREETKGAPNLFFLKPRLSS